MGKRTNKHNRYYQHHRYTPYVIKQEYLTYTSNHSASAKISKPCLFSYCQACAILKAIELNDRKKLSEKCMAQLAVFVSRAWDDNPSQQTIHQVFYMINNLLDTTSIDINQPFDIALQEYCSNTVSTPTICPSLTLLVAISYIERLNKRYKNLKGTAGCSFRMIMVAFIMASKYIHDSLQLIIYTKSQKSGDKISHTKHVELLLSQLQQMKKKTCPEGGVSVTVNSGCTDDTMLSNKDDTAKERNSRIARMELEFFHFLDYDLSVKDPVMLVKWAQTYDPPEENTKLPLSDSGDDADDEME